MKNKILEYLKKTKSSGAYIKDIYGIFKKNEKEKLKELLKELVKKGTISKEKNKYFIKDNLKRIKVKIIKDYDRFKIAQEINGEKEFLIFKEFSKNCFVEDVAVALILKNSNRVLNKRLKEAKIEKIIQRNDVPFTGTIIKKNNLLLIKPDSFSKKLFKIEEKFKKKLKVNDRVVAKIVKRFEKNSVCKIIMNCGPTNKAINCAKSIAISNGVCLNFDEEVLKQASSLKSDLEKEYISRLNLTQKNIFTIDSKTAKDLDDAISLEKFKDHYLLGVHIADVSHYVKTDSLLDKEAFKRGCSIYFADKVIPMLPKEISNDLCSLNPNEEKLTFSVFMEIDFKGNIIKKWLKKTIISSKIKGIYEEINDLFLKEEESEFFIKYKDILPDLKIMLELYSILKQKKINRNSPQIVTKESKIVLNEEDVAVKVEEKIQGVSEEIIEEFMIIANEAVATFAIEKNLPFLYRIHETPKSEKIIALKEILKILNIPNKKIKPGLKPKALSDILNEYENSKLFPILNTLILKSMSKARYDTTAIGHFGLVLKNYTHFTSPIRRYPDLLIHRILSDYILKNEEIKVLNKTYKKITKKAAKQSSKTERTAISIERSCTNCFKAEYMKDKIGETFKGVISFITDRGMFVILDSLIEGFVSISSLDNSFKFHKELKLISTKTNQCYEIGQKVDVTLISCNISLGKIDFLINSQ